MGSNGIMLKHDGWVVVADGERALFLKNKGDAMHPQLTVFREMEQENPPDREQGTDRPGRVNGGGAQRSSVEETDWHEIGSARSGSPARSPSGFINGRMPAGSTSSSSLRRRRCSAKCARNCIPRWPIG
jgi:hypothetical protein